MKNIEPEFKLVLRDFRRHLHQWDHDYSINSTQAAPFAIWEMEYQISFLSDQISERKIRETMSNQPDSDLYLMYILEGLENDPHYMDKYWTSNFKMFGKDYSTSEYKCLMSVARIIYPIPQERGYINLKILSSFFQKYTPLLSVIIFVKMGFKNWFD